MQRRARGRGRRSGDAGPRGRAGRRSPRASPAALRVPVDRHRCGSRPADGQVLVLHDMLGLYPWSERPRFVHDFTRGDDGAQSVDPTDALRAYVAAVNGRQLSCVGGTRSTDRASRAHRLLACSASRAPPRTHHEDRHDHRRAAQPTARPAPHRLRPDDGQPPRRPSVAHATRGETRRPRRREHLRQPPAVRAEGRLRALPKRTFQSDCDKLVARRRVRPLRARRARDVSGTAGIPRLSAAGAGRRARGRIPPRLLRRRDDRRAQALLVRTVRAPRSSARRTISS